MILSAAASSAGGLATAYAFASPSSRAPDLASGIPPLRMGSEYEFRCFDDKVGCWCRDAADGVRAVMHVSRQERNARVQPFPRLRAWLVNWFRARMHLET